MQFDGCNSDPATMDQGFPQFGAALAATGRSSRLGLVMWLPLAPGRPMVYQCEWPLYQGHHGISPNYTLIRCRGTALSVSTLLLSPA